MNVCAHYSDTIMSVFVNRLILLCRTLTTPVELIKCLRSIKEHAFIASEYPVVITLEDHLSADLQAKVADVSILIYLDNHTQGILFNISNSEFYFAQF